MHWRFGGNLEPVRMICETDWSECPKAIANYFWSEIVTDVLDCLSTEGIVWRVLAILFICTVILRQVYSKKRNLNENMFDKEILNKVGYKVEDLELKVNILTYKIQYGTWPLPHQVHRSGLNKGLRNVRLTLSTSNDYNEWLKNIMLSPRRNDSCTSHTRDTHRLTELFDAKRKNVNPYFQREKLLTTYSSSKSSKSGSGRMDLVEWQSRRKEKFSKSENFDMQHRNTASSRHRPRRKNARSTSKIRIYNDSNFLVGRNEIHPSKKFTKTMDECKLYLKELRDSNRSLALPCSSPEISDAPSIKNIWPEKQPSKRIIKTKETNETLKSTNPEKEMILKEPSEKIVKNSNTNTVRPVVSFLDTNVLPSKLNIRFCTELLPQPTLMNVSISPRFQQEDVTQKSFQTLSRVKEKLNSLQNVLRAYDAQNSVVRMTENRHGSDRNMHGICQNVMNTLVSITAEIENLNEKKKSKVSFEIDTEPNNNETPRTAYNSCEQCQSDDTSKTSVTSIQNYATVFENYRESDNHNFRTRQLNEDVATETLLSPCTHRPEVIGCFNENIAHMRQINEICAEPKYLSNHVNKYELGSSDLHKKHEAPKTLRNAARERIPERIYYTFSAESLKENDVEKQAENLGSFRNKYFVKNDDEKQVNCSDQWPVKMDTEEDLIILSPASSRAETSRGSEYDDKSTAMLLQEALQFKQALLTRVEFDGPCSTRSTKVDNEKFDPECEPSKISNIGDRLKSNLLDIILEEQSASSSAEKTNRTFVLLNMEKENNLSVYPNFSNDLPAQVNQNIVNGKNSMSRNVNSTTHDKVYNVENIRNDNDEADNNGLYYNGDTNKLSDDLQIRYLNANTLDTMSNEKLVDIESLNILTNMQKVTHGNSSPFDDEGNVKDMRKEKQDSVSILGKLCRRNASDDFACGKKILGNVSGNVKSCKLVSKDLEEPTLNMRDIIHHKFADIEFDCLKSQIVPESIKDDANFTLKRQHGMCSLLKQTVPEANSDQTHKIFEGSKIMVDSSPSESKENFAETSSTNNLQTLMKMMLNEKSANIEDVNCQDAGRNLGNYDNGDENVQTFSEDTIILCKSNEEPDAENNHREEDRPRNENTAGVINRKLLKVWSNQVEKRPGHNISLIESVISPHSSLYFTDEAPSSTSKLDNSNLESFGAPQNLNSSFKVLPVVHLDNARKCEDTDLQLQKLSKNYNETDVAPDLNFRTDSSEEHLYPDKNIEDKIVGSNRNASLEGSVSDADCSENAHLFQESKVRTGEDYESTAKNRNLRKIETLHTNDTNRNANHDFHTSFECPTPTDKETENTTADIFFSNISPYQVPPSNTRRNVTGKILGKSRSRSQEYKVLNSEKMGNSITATDANDITSHGSRYAHFTPIHLRNFSAEVQSDVELKNNFRRNRSKSQLSVRKVECSSQYLHGKPSELTRNVNVSTKRESSIESKSKVKAPSKSPLPIPKTSSKSCIPVLKSRLEAARRTEFETRPRSPVRGPLTVTTLWRDDLLDRDENITEDIVQAEGTSKVKSERMDQTSGEKPTDEENYAKKQHFTNPYDGSEKCDETRADTSIVPQERMVIYINIFTKYDQSTTRIVDPNKFLEYVKDRHLTATDDESLVATPSKCDKKCPSVATENQENTMRKVLAILSSIVNESDLNKNNHAVPCNSDMSNTSSANFTNVCFFTVEQREIDITAKPSVTDTSTSISDLKYISEAAKTAISNVQICGIPKELSNEEYVTLFEALNHKSNFAHFQQLQSLCRKLISKYPNVKRP